MIISDSGHTNKTYMWFGLRGLIKHTPSNWVEFESVKVFGITIGWWFKLASKGYVWNDGKIQK